MYQYGAWEIDFGFFDGTMDGEQDGIGYVKISTYLWCQTPSMVSFTEYCNILEINPEIHQLMM